jgi:hypothetical protein
MRSVSNACSEGVGEVPDDEVNAHLGNPGLSETSQCSSRILRAAGRGKVYHYGADLRQRRMIPARRAAAGALAENANNRDFILRVGLS